MEPTQGQIEVAAKAMYAADENCASVIDHPTHPYAWVRPTVNRDKYRKYARAAAPFLQMPWEEVTAEESETIHRGTGHLSVALVIKRFVELRNAALVPKPVDPRESIIVHAMCNDLTGLDDVAEAHRIAKRIIVAMDTAHDTAHDFQLMNGEQVCVKCSGVFGLVLDKCRGKR